MFSITEAAFAGLGVARRKPALVLWWGALALAGGLLLAAGVIFLGGPKFTLLAALFSPPMDPRELIGLFRDQAALLLWTLLVEITIGGVLLAAVNRAVQTPADDRWFYLRLGGDELRQAGTLFLWCLIMFATEIALLIPIGVVAVIVAVLVSVFVHDDSLAEAISVGVMRIGIYGLVLAGMAFVAVRLSLASPLTFDRKRIQVLLSWRMTKGRSWRLFASYLLAFAMGCVLEIVIFVIWGAIGMGTTGVTEWMTAQSMSSPVVYWVMSGMVWLMFGVAVGPVLTLTMLAPPAAIYQSIKGEGVQPDAST